MGTGSKILSVILRAGELCSFSIVIGLLGRFFYLFHLGTDESLNGRLIYAEVIAGLSIVASILLMPPLKYSFCAWPVDVVLFICSIVAFGLLADLSSGCSSHWYWNYWGYYWGRFWTVAPRATIGFNTIAYAGCGSWRSILSFLFMGSMAWFLSAILGIFVFIDIYEGRETHRSNAIKEKIMHKHHLPADKNHLPADTEAQQ
ncbi:hypothetical protein BCR34DRAFT_640649 [Clohesyomyces aquaticus]|uniref:MARVEL domain-containing protein n=1 Tax=Clohesyomyces aquaticus TaxID=1231657 RepID=A0A1Y1YM60_9PLEO|nr:hypothetical protein BCR34DRAFT_640649 [Clohesyomyces aquaticus]